MQTWPEKVCQYFWLFCQTNIQTFWALLGWLDHWFTGSPSDQCCTQEVIVSLLDLLISILTGIVWNPGYQLMSSVEEEEESDLKTGSRLASL